MAWSVRRCHGDIVTSDGRRLLTEALRERGFLGG